MLSDEEIGRIFAGESPIRVIREHGGMTLRVLAMRTRIPLDYLTACEAGKRKLSVGREHVVARELGVHPIALRRCDEHFADCATRLRRIPKRGLPQRAHDSLQASRS